MNVGNYSHPTSSAGLSVRGGDPDSVMAVSQWLPAALLLGGRESADPQGDIDAPLHV